MMIAEIFERLTQRKTEVARKVGNEWQSLVVRITDEQETDADQTFAELERLGKSIDELQAATKLLTERRAWSALVAAGEIAEAEHPRITEKINAEVAAFNVLEARHEARLGPMEMARVAAALSMVEAAQAKRELERTAADPRRLAVLRDADEKMSQLRIDRAEFDCQLRASEDKLSMLSRQEDPDLAGHVGRLRTEIATMKEQVPSFNERATALNAACDSARDALLNPEAI